MQHAVFICVQSTEASLQNLVDIYTVINVFINIPYRVWDPAVHTHAPVKDWEDYFKRSCAVNLRACLIDKELALYKHICMTSG